MESVRNAINELQDKVVDDFQSIGDPLSQYEYLLEFAGSLPALPAQDKADDNLVEGCQSQVWLVMAAEDGRLVLAADSDTLIVRGILHLLIDVLGGQRLTDVAAADIYFLQKADLMMTFNDSRRKGIGSTVATIKRFAAEHA